jgi:predicted nucleic acid-binding protein
VRRAVIDASVAIKWIVDETGSAAALSLLHGPQLLAPDLLMPECANILWKKVARAELKPDEGALAAELLQRADVELVPTRGLVAEALGLAVALNHPAYDCTYLALAIARDCPFVTADLRLARVVGERGTKIAPGMVLPLSAVP